MMNRTPAEAALNLVREDVAQVLSGRAEMLRGLRDKNLFITGGTGFLGTWLLELLRELNSVYEFETRVTVFSRHSNEFAQRWPHLGSHEKFTFRDGDIRHLPELPRDVTHVIHGASITDRRYFSSQPSAVAEVNDYGTARILKSCQWLEQLERFVLLSSGLVYGKQDWTTEKISETYAGPLRCDDPMTVYAQAKRMAEVLAHAVASESKIPISVLRPFAFVGPYQSLELPWAVTDFIRDCLNGGPIRIMGDGSTVRSIMYGSDFAFAVLLATATGGSRSTFNVGSPEPIDLLTLARMVTRAHSPETQILLGVGQTGHERSRLVPDTKHIEEELGFKPTVPLGTAIERSIQWHRLSRSQSNDSK